jgi:hypothetical protein
MGKALLMKGDTATPMRDLLATSVGAVDPRFRGDDR